MKNLVHFCWYCQTVLWIVHKNISVDCWMDYLWKTPFFLLRAWWELCSAQSYKHQPKGQELQNSCIFQICVKSNGPFSLFELQGWGWRLTAEPRVWESPSIRDRRIQTHAALEAAPGQDGLSTRHDPPTISLYPPQPCLAYLSFEASFFDHGVFPSRLSRPTWCSNGFSTSLCCEWMTTDSCFDAFLWDLPNGRTQIQ